MAYNHIICNLYGKHDKPLEFGYTILWQRKIGAKKHTIIIDLGKL